MTTVILTGFNPVRRGCLRAFSKLSFMIFSSLTKQKLLFIYNITRYFITIVNICIAGILHADNPFNKCFIDDYS